MMCSRTCTKQSSLGTPFGLLLPIWIYMFRAAASSAAFQEPVFPLP